MKTLLKRLFNFKWSNPEKEYKTKVHIYNNINHFCDEIETYILPDSNDTKPIIICNSLNVFIINKSVSKYDYFDEIDAIIDKNIGNNELKNVLFKALIDDIYGFNTHHSDVVVFYFDGDRYVILLNKSIDAIKRINIFNDVQLSTYHGHYFTEIYYGNHVKNNLEDIKLICSIAETTHISSSKGISSLRNNLPYYKSIIGRMEHIHFTDESHKQQLKLLFENVTKYCMDNNVIIDTTEKILHNDIMDKYDSIILVEFENQRYLFELNSHQK